MDSYLVAILSLEGYLQSKAGRKMVSTHPHGCLQMVSNEPFLRQLLRAVHLPVKPAMFEIPLPC